MDKEKCGSHGWRKALIRILLAAVFLYAGYTKLTNIAGTAGYITSAGLPYAVFLAWASGLLELIAGVLIAVGYWKRYAAWALIIFVILATYFFHLKGALSGDGLQITMTLKNLAIIGGLLMLSGCHRCRTGGGYDGQTCRVCGGSVKEGETKCERCSK